VALLLLATPLLGVLWLAIKLESQGPGFFTQTRIGKDGRSFTMYKLRTMRRDAEVVKVALAEADEGNGMLFKMRLDPRITGLGRFLRKTSLDELPQLLNVVLGQMSLVGPRPALPSEVEQYDDVVRRRLTVRPGMTGLWQVSGRSDLSWEQSVDLDLLYTDNYCLADDMRIGLRTVNAVVRARGAY
jgi:lipopolysaccharide/colanic/teichoic acid biosynthesis glycosyltransferase